MALRVSLSGRRMKARAVGRHRGASGLLFRFEAIGIRAGDKNADPLFSRSRVSRRRRTPDDQGRSARPWIPPRRFISIRARDCRTKIREQQASVAESVDAIRLLALGARQRCLPADAQRYSGLSETLTHAPRGPEAAQGVLTCGRQRLEIGPHASRAGGRIFEHRRAQTPGVRATPGRQWAGLLASSPLPAHLIARPLGARSIGNDAGRQHR